jgi:tRNA uridine 5-carbamoylmethylation protein Kti12
MYIVCFNGPPYSGKDTLARMVADYMDSQQVVVPTIVVSLFNASA